MKQLQQFGSIPFTHGALIALISEYKAPNDKISRLIESNAIIKLKKGLYVNAENYRAGHLCKEIIANSIYGPSYISLEMALSFYGIIPEKVYIANSITTKRSRGFTTPFGLFQYVQSKPNYYAVGISQGVSENGYNFLIASPEKALCDKIVFTKKLAINSLKGMEEYLISDMRANMDLLQNLDATVFEKCIVLGKKPKQLELLMKVLQKMDAIKHN